MAITIGVSTILEAKKSVEESQKKLQNVDTSKDPNFTWFDPIFVYVSRARTQIQGSMYNFNP